MHASTRLGFSKSTVWPILKEFEKFSNDEEFKLYKVSHAKITVLYVSGFTQRTNMSLYKIC